jgi:type I restriction enzyme M protein
VLGLVFLSYAEYRFLRAGPKLENRSSRRAVTATDYQALGVMFLPPDARYSMLLQMPEGANVGAAVNEAMRSIERENPDLKDVLPKTYDRFENSLLVGLLKSLNPASIGQDFEGDAFGKIYEYFLGKFAMTEGQKGGEFFTPTSVVELIVEILEPYHGRIYDPACGSGGMFVQSARFVDQHAQNPADEISVYGQEKTAETVRLCRMNLAVHGWSLNPGRYVGVAEKAADDFVFAERLEELNEELEVLNSEARELEDRIAQNVVALLEVAV